MHLLRKILIVIFTAIIPIAAGARTYFLLDNFNERKLENKLNGKSDTWTINDRDNEQFCKFSFDSVMKLGNYGFSLKLDYDVDTTYTYLDDYPNTAINGYYSKLNYLNLKKYRYIIFYIRGDERKGFTRTITIELKNEYQTGTYVFEGITNQWQRVSLRLRNFKGISDWSKMSELVFKFDEKVTNKIGTVYIDNIYFSVQDEPVKTTATRLFRTNQIKIDGDLTEWQKTKKITLTRAKNLESGEIKDIKDLSPTFAFMWDFENLYFCAQVFDDQIYCRERESNIWKEDCIELYIDPINNGFEWNNPQDFEIGFAPTGPDNIPQVWAWFQKVEPEGYVELASIIGEIDGNNAYQIEASVKWEFLGVRPERDKSIGVSVAFKDFDYEDNTSGKLNWFFMSEEGQVIIGKLNLK